MAMRGQRAELTRAAIGTIAVGKFERRIVHFTSAMDHLPHLAEPF
jgi:hypothetical protein